MWELVSLALGLVAFVLVFQLLSLPEWIETYLKKRRPRRVIEREVADLQRRVAELEARFKSER